MKVVILTPRASAPVSRAIIQALKERGVTVIKLNPGRISMSLDPDDLDIFKKYFSKDSPRGGIVRGIGTAKIKKIYHRLGLLRIFEENGVYLLNSRECLELATNKALTSYRLMKAGIASPKTILCENFKAAIKAFQQLGGDVVLKPLFGSKGVGIMRLTNGGFASNVFYNLDRMDEVFYIQEYKEHGNEDIRAMVLGNEVLCAMKRVANKNDKESWKTNVFTGARGEPIKLSSGLQEIAIKAAKAVKGEFVGVDIIETDDGPMIIEVNAVPGFNELQKTTNINIASRLVDYFLQKIRR
ncbi:MAG: ATP-grasp domain-containing protein [Promethearchaeota archaeon]